MFQTDQTTNLRTIRKISKTIALRITLGLLVAVLGIFTFSGGKAQAAACTPASGLTTLTKTAVSVPSAGTYNVWVRLKAGDGTGTSVGVEATASGGLPTCYTATSTDQTNWAWKNVGTFTASANNNTLKLVGTVPNVKVDRVILVPTAAACTPSNTRNTTTNPTTEPGDNCLSKVTTSPNGVVTPKLSPAISPVFSPKPVPTTPNPTPLTLGAVAPPSIGLVFDWLRGSYYIQVNWVKPTGTTVDTTYDVIRDNKSIATVTNQSYSDYSIAAAGKYSYKIQARDKGQTTSSVITTGTVNCFWIFCGLSQ